MKRANQLQPLSRQHHLGLNLGYHAKECADDPQEIAQHWKALSTYIKDMQHHFQLEDSLIVNALLPHQSTDPKIADVLNTMEQQHHRLNQLIAQVEGTQSSHSPSPHLATVSQVRELANLLYDHVRFEERELFPMVEKYLTEDQLNGIYDASPDNIKHLDEQR